MSLQGSLAKKLSTPLPSLIDFSLYSNLFVASVTTLTSYYWQCQEGIVSFHYLAFLFFATVFIYNLEHSQLKRQDLINKPKRSSWLIKNKRKVQSISAVAFMTYFSLFLYKTGSIRSISTLAMLLLCLIYCHDRFLKKIPLAKNLLLALIWSSATILMPQLWENKIVFSDTALLSFLVYFLASYDNSLLCDWNDVSGDSKEGLSSLASRINDEGFKNFVLIVSLLLFVISIISHVPGFTLTALAYMVFVLKKQKRATYMYDCCLLLPLLFMAIP